MSLGAVDRVGARVRVSEFERRKKEINILACA